MYKVISLFSGIGGSSQGYKQAGLNVVASVEFLDYQARTYRLNHPTTRLYQSDIRTLEPLTILQDLGLSIGELDILDGSPPCSSFSTSGITSDGWGKAKDYGNKRQRTDDLFWDYIRFVRAMKPKVFVAENVSGLIKGVSKGHFNDFMVAFQESGYKVSAKLLNAANYGVAQNRQRVIFIGVREDLGLLPTYPSVKQSVVSAEEALRGVVVDISENVAMSPNLLDLWHRTRVGGSFDEAMLVRSGRQSYFSHKRVAANKPANTITAHAGSDLSHWSEPRNFYSHELQALQSFPADYQINENRTTRIEGIGRSVPPRMMEAIARTIRTEILDKVYSDGVPSEISN